MTLPLLRNVRNKAKAILCCSNLKQIETGLLEYAINNKSFPYSFCNPSLMPTKPEGGYAGYSNYSRRGWWWFNFVDGVYIRSDEKNTIAKCPSKLLNDTLLNKDILCGNYAVNRSICKSSDDRQEKREEFTGKPLKIDEIPKPSQTLLCMDSGYALISWWNAIDAPPMPLGKSPIEDTSYLPGLSINKNRKLMQGQEQDAIYGRHPNKTVNVGFVDGHIEFKKANDLLVTQYENGYKNKNPIWVPNENTKKMFSQQ
ncbi:MAG: hypothetical protein A2Y12_18940 [Planctomycetes bacterium GWF2_42_9]|nr:MAG: hypothetical protein A2Y12_18940 [Planctomycetes bacterium GWF2_42_9]